MGAIAARKAAKILEHARWVLAAELLCAAEGLEYRNGLRPGEGVWRVYTQLRQWVAPLSGDRSVAGDIARIVDWIRQDAIQPLLADLFSAG